MNIYGGGGEGRRDGERARYILHYDLKHTCMYDMLYTALYDGSFLPIEYIEIMGDPFLKGAKSRIHSE